MTTETKPDMVDRLRDEADLCRNEGATDIAVLLDEAADELERLSAQVAQYREDAERYRWLKALAYIGIAPYPKPHEVWALRLPNLIGCTDLDAAIDKARKTT